jgi:hypothetical protein
LEQSLVFPLSTGLRPPQSRFNFWPEDDGSAISSTLVEVSRVEKGDGISSGSAIHDRFSSPMTIHELETVRVYSGCGDEKPVPIPGQRVRVYARLEDTLEHKVR